MSFFKKKFGSKKWGDVDANEVMDSLLKNIADYLQNSPNPLDKHKDTGVQWHSLSGLSSIHRQGKAHIKKSFQDVVLTGHVAFDKITAVLDIDKKLCWWFRVIGRFEAEVPSLVLATKVWIPLTGKIKPKLKRLKVKKWGGIKTNMTDTNWLGTIMSWFSFITNSVLDEKLPKRIETAADSVLDDVEFTTLKGLPTY